MSTAQINSKCRIFSQSSPFHIDFRLKEAEKTVFSEYQEVNEVMKKSILFVLVVLMCVSAFSLLSDSSAAETTIDDDSGTCGDGLRYKFEASTSALTISGTGQMTDYSFSDMSPWSGYAGSIKTISIGDQVTSIGSNAFIGCSSVTAITIPDSVTSLGDLVFYGCTNLASAVIGDSVTSIGNGDFMYCPSLSSVTIGKNVTSIGTSAFSNCALTSITLPDSVTSIGDSAFYGCASLTSLTIPDSVRSIGSYAFYNCTGLKELTIPISLDAVCSGTSPAFEGCTNIEKVTFTKGTGEGFYYSAEGHYLYTKTPWYLSTSAQKEIVISEEITAIGDYMFKDCSGITYISLPCSLTSLGTDPFDGTSFYDIDNSELDTDVSNLAGCIFKNENGKLTKWQLTLAFKFVDGSKTYVQYTIGDTSVVEPANSSADGGTCYWPDYDLDGSVKIVEEQVRSNSYTIKFCVDGEVFSTETYDYDAVIYEPDDVPTKASTESTDYTFVKWTGFTEGMKVTGDQSFDAEFSESTRKYQISFVNYNGTLLSRTEVAYGETPVYSGEEPVKPAEVYCRYIFDGWDSKIVPVTGETTYTAEFKEEITDYSGKDDSGTCGDDVNYYYEAATGTLTISGTGSMTDYTDLYERAPWAKYGDYIKHIIISGSVTHIGDYAFAAVSVISVDLGSVESIGNGAFHSCLDLPSVTIPDTVKTIGGMAFCNCSITTAVIGKNVTTIGSGAFMDCFRLTSVTIGESVETIEDCAFDTCLDLASVTFPASVKTIGDHAFEGCCSLTSLTVPDTVTAVGLSAFAWCTGLKEITIPISMNAVDCHLEYEEQDYVYLFEKCTNIEKVTFTKGTGTGYDYETKINSNNYYQYTPWYLSRSVLKEVVISDGITSIGTNMFRECSNVEKLTIPISLNAVGSNSDPLFKCFTNLVKVTFTGGDGAGVDYVNDTSSSSYYGYTPWYLSRSVLREIVLSDGITSIGSYMFYNCSELSFVDFPDTVTSVGDYAFCNCTCLAFAILDDSITSIGKSAFDGCKSLICITIPEKVTTIGVSAFCNCTALTEVEFNAVSCDDLTDSAEVFYNAGTSEIGMTVTFGKSVTKIPAYLFFVNNSNYAPNIDSVTVSDSVTSIGNYAFYNSTSLTSLVLGDSVTTIGEHAFYNCNELASVILSDSVTTIGESAFAECASLTTVTIGKNITTIGAAAFYRCISLTSVTIPDSVEILGNEAFKECTALKELTIPISLNAVRSNDFPVFKDCKAIEKVTFTKGNGTGFDYGVSTSSADYMYTPWGLSSSVLKEIILSDGITHIGNYAFKGCSKVSSITIPDSVTSIGNHAFDSCSSLSSISLPDSVTSLGNYVFYGCIGLKELTLPVSLNAVHDNDYPAFEGCTNVEKITFTKGTGTGFNYGNESTSLNLYTKTPWYLSTSTQKEVVLSEGIISIGDYTFKSCSGIKSVSFPTSLTFLGTDAFNGITFYNADGDELDDVSDLAGALFRYVNGKLVKEQPLTLTFKFIDGSEKTVHYAKGDTSVNEPANSVIPGYTCYWPEYKLDGTVSIVEEQKKVIGYTIIFSVDGKPFSEKTLDYGATITAPENEPTKAETASTIYAFVKWTGFTEGMTVTGDQTFEAEFSETVRTYKISFVNYDGTALSEPDIKYGEIPVYTGETPVKPGDGQYSYTFDGWDKPLTPVTGATTYTAKFDQSGNLFTVTFKNGDEILQQTKMAYGETPSYTGKTPVKTGDAQYSYEFKGWDKEIVVVTEDATYTAEFDQSVNKYTITFKNGDDVLLQSQVAYGETPKYTGETPVKPADEKYTYTFDGWNEDIVPVTEDATYTAKFAEEKILYTISFKNDDGTVILENKLGYGETITVPKATKESTAQYEYEFSSWVDSDGKVIDIPATVEGDLTAYASYTEKVREYTIKFTVDGEEFDKKTLKYGAAITAPAEDPTKASTVSTDYTFDKWEGLTEGMTVTGDQSFVAKFTETPRKYQVLFVNYDGALLSKTDVAYGETPVYTGETPVRPADVYNRYTFDDWNKPFAPVTEDTTYTAKFAEEKILYTISFKNDDGTVILENKLGYGETITVPKATKESTAQYDYEFKSWVDSDGKDLSIPATVEGDLTAYASYTEKIREYTITFTVDGQEFDKKTLNYGAAITLPTKNPTKESSVSTDYTFDHWEGFTEGMTVTGDQTFEAEFSETPRKYEISFVNYDGTPLLKTEVAYGETPVYTGDTPVKPADAHYSYTFKGWDKTLVAVTEDATYTAEFDQTVNTYTVTFKNGDEILQQTKVAYGETPSYTGKTPVKAGDAQYSYVFDGWDSEIVPVTGDATYTAKFITVINEYTVTFKNDNVVLQQTKVAYGETPVYIGETPVKPADAHYTYTFTGWDKTIVAVTEDATYTAEFDQTVNTYTVTFKNGDQILQESTLAYGETPVYSGETPVKPADKEYTYTFDGWDKIIVPVIGDVTYNAEFTQEEIIYTISFRNDDGMIILESKLRYGDAITVPIATKAATPQYEYEFRSWVDSDGKDISIPAAVDSELIAYASYTQKDREYTITFIDEGNVYARYTLHYGDVIEKPAKDPSKASDEEYDYTFSGWDGYTDGMKVTKTQTFVSVYTKAAVVEPDTEKTISTTAIGLIAIEVLSVIAIAGAVLAFRRF